MMSELTRLHDEAKRLLTNYEEHKHSDDADLRRKVHLDLDAFLMNNREVAAMMLVDGLQREIEELKIQHHEKKNPWYRAVLNYAKGVGPNASNKNHKA